MRAKPMSKRILLFGLFLLVQAGSAVPAQQTGNLSGTAELTWDGDLSARMVAGIDRFLMRRLEAAPEGASRFLEQRFLLRGRLRPVGRGQPGAFPQDHRSG